MTNLLINNASNVNAATPETKSLSHDYSMAYIASLLVLRIEAIGGDLAAYAAESNAFSKIKKDISQIQQDMDNLQKYIKDNPGATGDQKTDPKGYALAKKLETDLAQLKSDLDANMNTPSATGKGTYADDGMKEGMDVYNSIMNYPVNGSGSPTFQDMINNQPYNVPYYVVSFAKNTTSDSGPFKDWNKGYPGAPDSRGLDGVGTDFGQFLSSLTSTLNLGGQNLQQIQQIGQNIVNNMKEGQGAMVNNQPSR